MRPRGPTTTSRKHGTVASGDSAPPLVQALRIKTALLGERPDRLARALERHQDGASIIFGPTRARDWQVGGRHRDACVPRRSSPLQTPFAEGLRSTSANQAKRACRASACSSAHALTVERLKMRTCLTAARTQNGTKLAATRPTTWRPAPRAGGPCARRALLTTYAAADVLLRAGRVDADDLRGHRAGGR
jgi:hypothetical protein